MDAPDFNFGDDVNIPINTDISITYAETTQLLSGDTLSSNRAVIEQEISWLMDICDLRLAENSENTNDELPEAPTIESADGPYARFIKRHSLSSPERILLLASLLPHFAPHHLTSKFHQYRKSTSSMHPFLGGYFDPASLNFIPTFQTVIFLSVGSDALVNNSLFIELFFKGKLFHEQIIELRPIKNYDFRTATLGMVPEIAKEYEDLLLYGRPARPDFGSNFPAKWITTDLTWDQLVLNKFTKDEINDVMDWVSYGEQVIDISNGMINPSFPCLFYGPPGTGKTLTAKLIGKEYNKDVFRVDLSMVVSKYIGETEKNLARLFDRAQGKDWILFFDEADSLFGKRTGISDSKDKWANLEVSYLLQRMEEHKGLCILASNMKQNLDPALTRRFQAIIHFPFPKAEERAIIWQKTLPEAFRFPDNISFEKLARHDLSGAGIANAIKLSCVKAAKRGDNILSVYDISRFISLEFSKDNRTPVKAKRNQS
jgi:Cdc6-like AAA superfamily ATPase